MCCGDIFKWLLKLYSFIGVKSHELHLFGSSPLWAFTCGLKLPAWINAKSHWLHLFDLSPLCAFKCLLKSPEFIMVAFGFSPLCVFKCVLTTVRIFWPSRAVAEGPHGRTDHKKSLYTLHVDPEKSRDFIFRNPGILINWKSRDSRDPARVCRSPYPLACWPPCQHPFQPPCPPPCRQL